MPHLMTSPAQPERKACTFDFPIEHVEHLDAQAEYLGCSRAAYVRQLIVRDIERQGPAKGPAKP
jgi:predicted DNA-binding protein